MGNILYVNNKVLDGIIVIYVLVLGRQQLRRTCFARMAENRAPIQSFLNVRIGLSIAAWICQSMRQ